MGKKQTLLDIVWKNNPAFRRGVRRQEWKRLKGRIYYFWMTVFIKRFHPDLWKLAEDLEWFYDDFDFYGHADGISQLYYEGLPTDMNGAIQCSAAALYRWDYEYDADIKGIVDKLEEDSNNDSMLRRGKDLYRRLVLQKVKCWKKRDRRQKKAAAESGSLRAFYPAPPQKIRIHITNVSLTDREFNEFCIFLQLVFPCQVVEDGIVIEERISNSPEYWPELTPPIPSPVLAYRMRIKIACEKLLKFIGGRTLDDVEQHYTARIEVFNADGARADEF